MKFRKVLLIITALCSALFVGCMPTPEFPPKPVDFPQGEREEIKFGHYVLGADMRKYKGIFSDAVENYPEDELILPDGSTVSKFDAVGGDYEIEVGSGLNNSEKVYHYGSLMFDFAFYKMLGGDHGSDASPSCVKAVKGDVLENGLVVDRAFCDFSWIRSEDEPIEKFKPAGLRHYWLGLKGETTLSGKLYFSSTKSDLTPSSVNGASYGTYGFLYFRPDGKDAYLVPVDDFTRNVYDSDRGWYYYFGDIRSKTYEKFEFEALFDGKDEIDAVITIKDPMITTAMGAGTGAFGELVGVEKIQSS